MYAMVPSFNAARWLRNTTPLVGLGHWQGAFPIMRSHRGETISDCKTS